MRTLHIFAGAGGGLLADIILGHTPIAAIEWNPYACAVLRSRAADGWLPGLDVIEQDVRNVDFSAWAGRVDCIAAGFPCQDISAAGKGAGIDGERSGLYREVFRAIDVIRPRFVWLENSPRIRLKGRHTITAALVARGYSWRDGTLAASDVGAPHIRNRWWLLASNANSMRQLQSGWRISDERGRPGNCITQATTDTLRDRLQVARESGAIRDDECSAIEAAARYTSRYDWSPPNTGVCGMVDGLAPRLVRIECLGNGQVPLQAAAAWIILSGGTYDTV